VIEKRERTVEVEVRGKVRKKTVTSYRAIGRWHGYPTIIRSFGTRTSAKEASDALYKLWRAGRLDMFKVLDKNLLSMPNLLILLDKYTVDNVPVPSPKGTIGVLRDEWLEYMRADGTRSRAKRGYAPATIERYETCLKLVIAGLEHGDDTDAGSITEQDLEKALAKVKGATRNRRLTALQSFARWCRKTKGIQIQLTSDDYAGLRDDERDLGIEPALTEGELARMRAAAVGLYPQFWMVLARTGLRVSECQELRGHHISEVKGQVWVKVVEGKTFNAPRTIPVFDDEAAKFLQGVQQTAGRGYIWPNKMRAYGNCRKNWDGAAARAGFLHAPPEVKKKQVRGKKVAEPVVEPKKVTRPAKTMHGLRHTFGVTLARLGTPGHLVLAWMGHSSVTMQDRYQKGVAEEIDVVRLAGKYKNLGSTTPQDTPGEK